jgi:membrane-associated phospholipid phosphatase
MAPEERTSLVRAPLWMVAVPPSAALTLLLAISLAGLDRNLFFPFNDLSSFTGPGFWAHVTILGDGLVCAVLFLPWVRRFPQRIWAGVLAALLMVLILRSFKAFLGLPRPLGVLPEEMVTVIGPGHRRSAFPSGHAATIALFAGIWALSTSRRALSWLALSLATLVGVSRMAVGVHWPSDVLAGFALGWVSAWIGLRWAARAPWGTRSPGRYILAGALMISALVLLSIDHTGYPGVLLFQKSLALGCIILGGVGLAQLRGWLPVPDLADPPARRAKP